MTAAARKLASRPSPLQVFTARAEARALLWQAGEVDLHDAVDELQASAVRDGLVAELGQDRVQAIMLEAFAPVSDDHSGADQRETARVADADPLVTGLKICADTQFHLEQWEKRKAAAPVADGAELSRPAGVPAATIKAAEYLVQQGDAERFRNWLDQHSADERTAIRRYLEAKRCH